MGSGEPPADEQLLTVSTRVQGTAVIVTAIGEVDILTTPRLRAALDGALRQAAGGPVVVDLSRVTLLASSGLHALVEAAQQAEQRREPLRIVVDYQKPVLLPIQITDLDEVLALYHSLDDALAVPD